MASALANIIYGWPFEASHQAYLSESLSESDFDEPGSLMWGPGEVNENVFETLYTANGSHTPAFCGILHKTLGTSGTTSLGSFHVNFLTLTDLDRQFKEMVKHLPEDAVQALQERYGESKLWVVWSTT